MFEQTWPTKQPDGSIKERHVYSGPQGEGYIDFVYRQKQDGSIEVRKTHVGPEDRDSYGFKDLTDNGQAEKCKRIIEGKATWTPNIGFKINPEFENDYDKDGTLKPKPPVDPAPKGDANGGAEIISSE